ncbi:cation:proton antiporter [Candidatus Woesearchaeota archaeon]|nr:cation:proton antiporter [Candidatus Woesearchaeota archaeon]
MDVNIVLLGVGLIIVFGFFAEFMFKKVGVPDILFLVLLGFLIGPHAFGWVQPEAIAAFAPVFTTFALLFLLFEGALSIDLKSFARGLLSGSSISLFNFIISAVTVTAILALLKFDFLLSLLIGCALGGVSSAFVMPLLKQLKPNGKVYTMLALESAITDVFTIVFALTIMQLIQVNVFSFKNVMSQIISLFAVAGLIGIIGASLWIFLDKKVFKEHKSFMSTIAFLLILYFITEFLGGNGAIAALFFGLVLSNSKQLGSIIVGIRNKPDKSNGNGEEKKSSEEETAKNSITIVALSEEEHRFYSQISFFLKIFFFVYIGLLLNINNSKAIMIGGLLALTILGARNLSLLITRKMDKQDKSLINSIFARGLAAAAVIQIVFENGILTDPLLLDITYFFIVTTILLSSARVFIHKIRFKKTDS